MAREASPTLRTVVSSGCRQEYSCGWRTRLGAAGRVPCRHGEQRGECQRIQAPDRAGPRRLDIAFLTEFFRRLETRRDDARARRVQWIVALLLLRRRVLEEVSRSVREGHDVLLLRLRRDETEFEVEDPLMDAAAMASIEEDLARIFNLEEGPRAGSAPGS